MNNDWLDLEILEDYLDGKLDAKTMNRVEREALDDPFIAEALAGLSASPKRSLQSLSILQKQLQERINQQQTIKKRSVITWQRLSIAAAAAVLFIAVSIMFWFRASNNQKQLTAAPAVSVLSSASKMTVLSERAIDQNDENQDRRSDYILKNNKFAKAPKLHQAVELAFNVSKEGKAINIKVTKSLGKKYDEEAIRLIKDGPAWKQPQNTMEKTIFKIEF